MGFDVVEGICLGGVGGVECLWIDGEKGGLQRLIC
jgi:hypothetical protein